ncbi:MAG: BlaI/MecI/CopY family transcriptional regulator [Bacteroidetes bacterium]|nr:BlaI/MecI/CopY family transcriptional regulator [Bacteroidota bacterium]
MIKLAKREEQIMKVFWDKGQAFIRDIIPHLPDPKPHYNSVATIVKVLEEKGFLERTIVGNVHQYYPLVSKEKYQTHIIKDVVKQYFDNSYPSMLAFFAKEEKLSETELKEIMKIIKSSKK